MKKLTHLCPEKDYWANFFKFLHMDPCYDQIEFFALCRYIFVPPGINGLIISIIVSNYPFVNKASENKNAILVFAFLFADAFNYITLTVKI